MKGFKNNIFVGMSYNILSQLYSWKITFIMHFEIVYWEFLYYYYYAFWSVKML